MVHIHYVPTCKNNICAYSAFHWGWKIRIDYQNIWIWLHEHFTYINIQIGTSNSIQCFNNFLHSIQQSNYSFQQFKDFTCICVLSSSCNNGSFGEMRGLFHHVTTHSSKNVQIRLRNNLWDSEQWARGLKGLLSLFYFLFQMHKRRI